MASLTKLSWADPDLSVLGQFRNAAPKAECTLAQGVAALESQILENIRTKGNYGPHNKDYPSIHAFREGGDADLKKDSPQGWVEAFLQYLFPSSGLVRLVESTKDSEFAYKLKKNKKMIGRVLAALRSPQINGKEVRLTGAVTAAFKPQLFKSETRKIINEKLYSHLTPEDARTLKLKIGKEGMTSEQQKMVTDASKAVYKIMGCSALRTLEKKGESVLASPSDPQVLAALTVKAYLTSHSHPPHIVEQALWALAWKTSSTAEEMSKVYKGLLGTEAKHEEAYDKEKDYDALKQKILDKRSSEKDDVSLAIDPFLATYTQSN